MTGLRTYRAIALLLAALAGAPALAGPFEDALVAYGCGYYFEAIRLFRPLAEQGHAGAQYYVGVMYASGEDVPRDYAEAMRWYRRAADQGYDWAQNNIGLMYLTGQGVARDNGEALAWFRRAAGQGNVNAQNNRGTMYRDGDAVPVDPVAAHLWFDLAAQRGFQPAAKNRDALRAGMSEAQLAQAQRLAREWKPN